MNRPFLIICVPGIVVVAGLIVLMPTSLHPNFMSDAAIPVDPEGSSAARGSREGRYQRIAWRELAPKKWDSQQVFNGQNIASWSESDPRALKLLSRMRTAWDNAPVNMALSGRAVRTAGYVVPIDESRAGLREFLLVPYFGSCIHIPPPPADQIIDVSVARPVKGLHAMDAVWVDGVMTVAQGRHEIGDSAYALVADHVDVYTGPSQ